MNKLKRIVCEGIVFMGLGGIVGCNQCTVTNNFGVERTEKYIDYNWDGVTDRIDIIENRNTTLRDNGPEYSITAHTTRFTSLSREKCYNNEKKLFDEADVYIKEAEGKD